MGDEVEALRNELASLEVVELDLESGPADARVQACSMAVLHGVSQSPHLTQAPHPLFSTIMF